MREIYMYSPGAGEVPIADFFNHVSVKVRNKVEYLLWLVRDESKRLGAPHIKHFVDERYKMLYELRTRADAKMVRIIFCEYNGNILLLHAFLKRNNRDTERALEYAFRLFNGLTEENIVEVIDT